MERRFPLRRKGPPPKSAACEAIGLSMKPFRFHARSETVPLIKPMGSGTANRPAILNFPVRAL